MSVRRLHEAHEKVSLMGLLGNLFKSKEQIDKERAEERTRLELFATKVEPILQSCFERFNHEASRKAHGCNDLHLINLVYESFSYAKDIRRYCLALLSLDKEFDYPPMAPEVRHVILLLNFSHDRCVALAPEDLYGRKRLEFTDAQKAKFLKIVRQDFGSGLSSPETKQLATVAPDASVEIKKLEDLKKRYWDAVHERKEENSRLALFNSTEKKNNLSRLDELCSQLEAEIERQKDVVNNKIEASRGDATWWQSQRGVSLEVAISAALRAHGYSVRSTPATGDGGIDLILDVRGTTYLVQCKGWEGKVGVAAVRDMAGVLAQSGGDVRGLIVAPNDFTSGARSFANQCGILMWTSVDLVALRNRPPF